MKKEKLKIKNSSKRKKLAIFARKYEQTIVNPYKNITIYAITTRFTATRSEGYF